jgi:hypothetical protein
MASEKLYNLHRKDNDVLFLVENNKILCEQLYQAQKLVAHSFAVLF